MMKIKTLKVVEKILHERLNDLKVRWKLWPDFAADWLAALTDIQAELAVRKIQEGCLECEGEGDIVLLNGDKETCPVCKGTGIPAKEQTG